jgi:hypothetical protein
MKSLHMRSDRRGFVLAFVVFMLFAISVAGMTGYMVVASEYELSKYAREGTEALTVARAALERFVAEQIGVVPDSVTYALGDGVAVVTTRKVFARDSLTDVYFVRSEATVDDVLTSDLPARRVVGGYAVHHRRPIGQHGTVLIGADNLQVNGTGEIYGWDHNSVADCPGGGANDLPGGIARLSVTEDVADAVEASPEYELWPGGASEIADSVGLRWDVLTDPDFPVDYENSLPDFSLIPADSFPVIRYTGWVVANFTGRGALIVDGVFDPGSGFSWDGIVVAEEIDDAVEGYIDGILIAGMEGPNTYPTIDFRLDVDYYSCFVYAANESLSYLELLPNTIHEVG